MTLGVVSQDVLYSSAEAEVCVLSGLRKWKATATQLENFSDGPSKVPAREAFVIASSAVTTLRDRGLQTGLLEALGLLFNAVH
jgi:hypothetical protein